MTGFDCYKLYLAIKLHFNSASYDFFKYCGKIKSKPETYNTRKDKYFFEKLANKYNQDTLVDYFVSNFISEDVWVGDITKPKGEKVYYNWKKKINSLSYFFKEEFTKVLDDVPKPYNQNFDGLFESNSSHPQIIKKYFSGEVSLETLVILNQLLNFVPKIKDDLVIKPVKTKVLKYSPFLKVDKDEYKRIVREIFNG